jgi:hypothetical protein
VTDRSSDTPIDFFDERPGQAAPRRRRRPSRGGSSTPRRPVRPPSGLTPLLRLAGLVAFAIVLVVILSAWVQSCRSEGQRDAYREYMEAVSAIAADSEQVGEELNAALTTPGIQFDELRQRLGNLAQQQEQEVIRASELTPPGRLRLQHQQAVEALQFRVSGLRRLQDVIQQNADSQNPGQAGAQLAEQMLRLVASDVIWEDQFRTPSMEILRTEGIGGVEVPTSTFLANADVASQRVMALQWERLLAGVNAGSGTPTGLHGNALISVRAMPAGQVLTADEENVITASPELAFEATVENSGNAQEVRVRVTLELDQSPRPIEREEVIDLINPGERQTVVFRDVGQIVQFQQEMEMRVEVAPVPGETNLDNNSATYRVRFALPQ